MADDLNMIPSSEQNDEGLTLETSVSLSLKGGNLNLINSYQTLKLPEYDLEK